MDAGLKTYRQIAEQKVRDQLIMGHLQYVKSVLGKILIEFPTFVDTENLEAAGVLGLVEAANRFSPHLGVEFKTFAYQRIRGAVYDELRRNCPLPQQILKHWAMIREVLQDSEEDLNSESISQRTGLSLKAVETCLSAIRMTAPETWHDEIFSQQIEQNEPASETTDRHALLVRAIEELPQRDREIVTMYHNEELTLKQIGEVVGLSESRVSRLLANAELMLKRSLRHFELESISVTKKSSDHETHD